MSLLTGVFLVFLVLKLVGVITWSWLWVTCPLWAIPVLLAGSAALALLGIGAARAISPKKKRRRRR